jgi:hypothetical protein
MFQKELCLTRITRTEVPDTMSQEMERKDVCHNDLASRNKTNHGRSHGSLHCPFFTTGGDETSKRITRSLTNEDSRFAKRVAPFVGLLEQLHPTSPGSLSPIMQVDTMSLGSDDDHHFLEPVLDDEMWFGQDEWHSQCVSSPNTYFTDALHRHQLPVLLEEDENSIDEGMEVEPMIRCIIHSTRANLGYSFKPLVEVRKERLPVVHEGDEASLEVTTFPATPTANSIALKLVHSIQKGGSPVSLFPFNEEEHRSLHDI